MRRENQQLYTLLAPVVTGMGYDMLGIERYQRRQVDVVCIYIDHPEGISADDCAKVSHQIEGLLDVKAAICGYYHLEVSSPGLDRPLFTLAHFESNIGNRVRVRLYNKLAGRQKYEGQIHTVSDDQVCINESEQTHWIPAELIKRANLVPEDLLGVKK